MRYILHMCPKERGVFQVGTNATETTIIWHGDSKRQGSILSDRSTSASVGRDVFSSDLLSAVAVVRSQSTWMVFQGYLFSLRHLCPPFFGLILLG